MVIIPLSRSSHITSNHTHITMTSWWARWRLKSPASRLFTQPFVQAQIKENIKAPHHWPLCGEFTGHRWQFPTQRASNAENVSIWWRHHDNEAKCVARMQNDDPFVPFQRIIATPVDANCIKSFDLILYLSSSQFHGHAGENPWFT